MQTSMAWHFSQQNLSRASCAAPVNSTSGEKFPLSVPYEFEPEHVVIMSYLPADGITAIRMVSDVFKASKPLSTRTSHD